MSVLPVWFEQVIDPDSGGCRGRAGIGAGPPGPARPRRARTRPDRGPVADDHQPRRRQSSPAASSWTRSAGRRCRPSSNPSTRRLAAGRLGMPARAQQLGDAFVQWADITLAAGPAPILRTVKPHVVVTDRRRRPGRPRHRPRRRARWASAPLISAARARWLACDGEHQPDRHGPRRPGAGLRPQQARSSRRALRRAVEIRDRHCVFAGCEAPTHWCDVHHVLRMDARRAARPRLENSALLCERHHTKVHHGFRIERRPDGRWHT